jgi:methionyl-tRNA formyltransferase
MRVTEGLDSGPVALREEIPIGDEDDFGTLSERLESLGGELLIRALDLCERGELSFEEQDDSEATYAEKVRPEERRLDPGRSAAELARTVRALTPHVGTFIETAEGGRLGVRRASAVAAGMRQGELRSEDGTLLLGCAEAALRLEVVQPEGGRPMAADAYLRGHPLPEL